jgi:hypothetical protein
MSINFSNHPPPTVSADLPTPGWNSPDRLSLLRRAILDLSLPEWCGEAEERGWEGACTDVADYLGAVIEADEEEDGMPALYSR